MLFRSKAPIDGKPRLTKADSILGPEPAAAMTQSQTVFDKRKAVIHSAEPHVTRDTASEINKTDKDLLSSS